jgi:hypothetical protein
MSRSRPPTLPFRPVGAATGTRRPLELDAHVRHGAPGRRRRPGGPCGRGSRPWSCRGQSVPGRHEAPDRWCRRRRSATGPPSIRRSPPPARRSEPAAGRSSTTGPRRAPPAARRPGRFQADPSTPTGIRRSPHAGEGSNSHRGSHSGASNGLLVVRLARYSNHTWPRSSSISTGPVTSNVSHSAVS